MRHPREDRGARPLDGLDQPVRDLLNAALGLDADVIRLRGGRAEQDKQSGNDHLHGNSPSGFGGC